MVGTGNSAEAWSISPTMRHKTPPPTKAAPQDDPPPVAPAAPVSPAAPAVPAALLQPPRGPIGRPIRPAVLRPSPRPELTAFRNALVQAMINKNVSASGLSRLVWGETTDNRGYRVARNRDRMTSYLAGTVYPSRETLGKLAAALGIEVAALEIDAALAGAAYSAPLEPHQDAVDMRLRTASDGTKYASLFFVRPREFLYENARRILDIIDDDDKAQMAETSLKKVGGGGTADGPRLHAALGFGAERHHG